MIAPVNVASASIATVLGILYRGVLPLTVIGPVKAASANKAAVRDTLYRSVAPLTVIATIKAGLLPDQETPADWLDL